jgi:hypothetical protein
MPDVLVAAFITDAADAQIDNGFTNAVELGYSDHGSSWGFGPVQMTSMTAAGLAILGDQIWVAGRDGDGSRIYATSPSIGVDSGTGQSSPVAPALATFGPGLAIAYVGAASGHVEVITSGDGTTWSPKSDSGQSSKHGPAAIALGSDLWVAYVGAATGHVELVRSGDGTSWSAKFDTGQATDLSPAIAAFEQNLWVAYVDASTRAVQVIYSADGGNSWKGPFATGQTSRHSPGLTAFKGALWLAYIGASTGNVELVSFFDGSGWSPKTDTRRSSKSGVALATISAANGPDPLRGHSQYVLTSTLEQWPPDTLAPLPDVAVQITITEELTFDQSLPPSFQLNCYSPRGNTVLGAQQYVIAMQPDSKVIYLHLQNFYPDSVIAAYAGTTSRNIQPDSQANVIKFPKLGAIPAGWSFSLQLLYAGNCVAGAVCTVTDEAGATIGALSLEAVGLPLAKQPGNVDDSWLAPIVALELDIVGYSEGAFTTFQSGRAFAVYNSLAPLKVNGSYASYVNSAGNGTTEDSNCVNGLIPIGTTWGTVQCFGVPNA